MRYLIPLLNKRVGSIVLLLGAIAIATPVKAEGSKDLISSGGDRPFLEYQNATRFFIGSIPRRNVIKVYAKVGETISLGSSAIGVNSAKILYRKPDGSSGSCDGTSGGLIPNRNAEIAGPAHPVTNPLITPTTTPYTGPFQPCNISLTQATEEGIWEIEFESPAKGTNDPSPISASANWSPQANGDSWVTAWDVTVRNSNGIAQPGRAFANYLALNMGNNNRALSSTVYIQTNDGYGYTIDMNDIDPFGFAFFANNKGFRDAAGNSIYRSLQLAGANPGTMPSNYSVQLPNSADSSTNRDFTHKIFFNTTNTANTPSGGPDITMPKTANSPSGSTWLYDAPKPPPTPSNLGFTGIEGTSGAAGTSPLGGTFSFTTTTASAYSIVIDLNGDGIYGNTGLVNGISISDRYILGTATAGTNNVFWDGKDQNGVTVPASANTIKAIVTQYAGEIHFPFLDPENNPRGLIIQRVKDPGTAVAPTAQVFYDDRLNSGANNNSLCASGEGSTNCYGTPPSPRQAVGGVDSTTGAHAWSNLFGDIRGMDTWAYYPSAASQTISGFVIREADLSITKTDNLTSIAAGSSLTYTIVVRNNGPSDANDATVQDTLPAQLTNATWTCTASTGSSCTVASGTGSINTKVNLLNGGTATFTVTGVVSVSATGTISNTAIVLRPNDVNDPTDPNRIGAGNNSATDTTTITAPVPRLRLVKRITALNGISYTDTINDPADPNDDSSNYWTTGYLIGRTGKGFTAADTVPVKPGDALEYTIYFLSDGGIPAQNITLCDLVPANTTFVANAFNGNTPTDGGTPSANLGMRLTLGNSTVYLSNDADSPDRGQFFAPGTTAPCGNNGASIVAPNGAVTVKLNSVTNATAQGTPNSFGFIRFRARVN